MVDDSRSKGLFRARPLTALAALALALLPPSLARADDDSTATQPETLEKRTRGERRLPDLAELSSALERTSASPTLRPGTTAIYVVDAKTGTELFKLNENEPLNPASNVKLVSTSAVLDALGPDWRFQTHLIGAPPDEQGRIAGDLFLHGDYDPTLGPGAFHSLAKQLSARGVTELEGSVVLDGSEARDLLAARRIRVTVRSVPGRRELQVKVWPHAAHLVVDTSAIRHIKKGRSRIRMSQSLETLEDGKQQLRLTLSGRLRKGHKRVATTPIKDPAGYSAKVMEQALLDAGIAVGGPVTLASFADFQERQSRRALFPETLALHESPDMATLVARVNKRSLNHLADRLVMSAARSQSGSTLSMDDAVALMTRWLEREQLATEETVLDTGSGLSYQSRLSARQIVGILRRSAGYDDGEEARSQAQQAFYDSLSIATEDGTLRRRFRSPGHPIELPLRGKTGTLTGIIALSGFLEHPSGRTLAFSILSNGHPKHFKRSVRLVHEELVAHMDDYIRRHDSASYAALLAGIQTKKRKTVERQRRATRAAYAALLGAAAPSLGAAN